MTENIDLFEDTTKTTKNPNKHHPYRTGAEKRRAERKAREERGENSDDDFNFYDPEEEKEKEAKETPIKKSKYYPYKTAKEMREAEKRGDDLDIFDDDIESEPKKTKAKKEKKAISPEKKKEMVERLQKGRAKAKAAREAKKLAKEQEPKEEQPKEEEPKEEPKTNELEILKNELKEFRTQYKSDMDERKARKLLKQQKKEDDEELAQIKTEQQRVKQVTAINTTPTINPRFSTNNRNRPRRLNLVL